jgi:hypothetical protein
MASSSAPRRGRASVAFGSEAEVRPAGSAQRDMLLPSGHQPRVLPREATAFKTPIIAGLLLLAAGTAEQGQGARWPRVRVDRPSGAGRDSAAAGRRLLSRPGHRTHGHRPTFDALDHAQPPAAADNGSRAPARADVPLHRVIPQRSATRARSTAAPLRRASAIVGTLPRRPALRARRSARRGCRHLPGPPGRNYRSPPARRPARLPSSPSAKILARRDDAHRVRGQGFLGRGRRRRPGRPHSSRAAAACRDRRGPQQRRPRTCCTRGPRPPRPR